MRGKEFDILNANLMYVSMQVYNLMYNLNANVDMVPSLTFETW